MACKYERILETKSKGTLGERHSGHLKQEEIERLINDLAGRIKLYEKVRKREMETLVVYNTSGDLKELEMKSKDGIVEGRIYHKLNSRGNLLLDFYTEIMAEFDFKSQNEADKDEYLGLVSVIRNWNCY